MLNKRTIIAMVLAVVITASVASSVSIFLVTPPQNAMTPVLVRLDWLVTGKHVGWFTALDKGYYAQRGIAPQIERGYGSADTVKLVELGKADVGFADFAVVFISATQGGQVKLVGAVYGDQPAAVLAWKDLGISTPQDLARGEELVGRKFKCGLAQTGVGPVLFPALAKRLGYDVSKIEAIPVSGAELISGLLAEQWDCTIHYFASGVELALLEAEKLGRELAVFRYSAYGLNMYSNGLIATESMIKEKPEIVGAYVEGTMAGFEYAIRHPDEALEILFKYHPELRANEKLTRMQMEYMLEAIRSEEALANGLGYFDEAKVKQGIELLKQYQPDLGPLGVKPSDIYTNQFIKKTYMQ